MSMLVKMNLEEWIEKFKPAIDSYGEIVEATREQLKNTDIKYVWTRVYADYGSEYMYNGFHSVNSDGSFITEVPYENVIDTYIITLFEPDEDDLIAFLEEAKTEAEKEEIIKDFAFYFKIRLGD